METAHDQETGEIYEPSIAERAMAAGRDERRERKERAMGVGLIGIYKKLAKAYSEIAPVLAQDAEAKAQMKTKTGGTVEVKSSYTRYPTIIKLVRKPLLDNGILIRHRAGHVFQMGDGQYKTLWVPVTTDLIDVDSGDVISCEFPMPIARPDPRSVGSAISFGKRYTLLGALGIATGDVDEDDDAQSAMPRDISESDDADEIITDIHDTKSEADARKLRAAYQKRIDNLDQDGFERVKKAFQAHVKALRSGDKPEPGAPAKGKHKPGPKDRIANTHEGGRA